MSLQKGRPQVRLDHLLLRVGCVEAYVGLLPVGAGLVVDDVGRRLVAQSPGQTNALLNVLQQALARFEGWIVVQGGPNLLAHLLLHKCNMLTVEEAAVVIMMIILIIQQ